MKPDFWQDDKIGSLSIHARLLAIALLNFADDEGRFQATPIRLKVFAFPYDQDDIDIESYLKELCDIQYLIPGEKDTYQIKNFLRHQVIDRPKPSHLPPVLNKIVESSSSDRRELDGEGKGREGKGRDIGTPTGVQSIVEHFKMTKDFTNVPNWDRVNFPRCAKAAKELLSMASSVERSVSAIDGVKKWAEKEGLTWTLETVVKRYPEWAKKSLPVKPPQVFTEEVPRDLGNPTPPEEGAKRMAELLSTLKTKRMP